MNKENIIQITNDAGEVIEVEVLNIFGVNGYDKDYVLYTQDRQSEEGQVECFVSIVKENEDEFVFETITDDAEWDAVQMAIAEMSGEE